MKRLFNICFCICLSFFTAACSQDAPVDENIPPVENQEDPTDNSSFVRFEGEGHIEIAFEAYEEDATRAVKHEWKNGDTLLVFPQSSSNASCIGYFLMEEGDWRLYCTEALLSQSQTLNINSYYGENAGFDRDSDNELIMYLNNAPFCTGTGTLTINIDTQTGASSYYIALHFRQYSTRIRVSGVPEGETVSIEGPYYPYTVYQGSIYYYYEYALEATGDEENNAYFYVYNLTEGTPITFRTETGSKEFVRTTPRTIENASTVTFAMPTPESHDGWTAQDNQLGLRQIYITTTDGEPITPKEIENNNLVGFEYLEEGFRLTYANPVTELSNDFFTDATTLQNITLPASLEKIGSYAFSGCTSLASIVIPDATKEIDYAFSGCTGLRHVTMPGLSSENMWTLRLDLQDSPLESLTITCGTVPDVATGKQTLKKLVLLDEVTEISGNAFAGCTELADITWSKGLKRIGRRAFESCSSITSLELPQGLEAIESSAFSACAGLASIVLPNTLTDIGDGSFSNCSNLTEVTMPGKPEDQYWGIPFGGCPLESVTITSNAVPNQFFRDITTLKNVTLNEGVTSIKDYAFAGCSGLTGIVIPSTVSKIESNAFENCTGLTSFTIPDAVKKLGADVFKGCTNLSTVTTPGYGNIDYLADCPIQEITFTSGSVGGFSNRTTLPSITLKEGVTDIASVAFAYCPALTELTLPSTVWLIGMGAFCGTSLTALTLPEGLQIIESRALSETQLTEIDLPDGITELYDGTFESCTELKRVKLPRNLTNLGDHTFKGCSALTEIDLPASLTTIGYDAFRETGLTHIELPESVTKLGEGVFHNCKALASVSLSPNIRNIGEILFYNCTRLASIELPAQLETIGSQAFYGTRLATITLPATLKSIGSQAFSFCRLLSSVTCLAVTPPTIETDTFSESFTGPVSVPAESIPAYQNNDNWSWFTFEALP